MTLSFPPSTWRLLLTPPARGAWNMALDEAILESVGRGDALTTLRLYAWNPPCLSLGYAQPFTDVDLPALQARGWELVRRPTGGRAILHTDELTYSMIGPPHEPPLAGGVLESYRVLSKALLRALHLLGIPAEALEKPVPAPEGSGEPGNDPQAAGAQNPVCFEAPSNYEITVGGKKLVGSAQARRKEGVLQHGSLLLSGDLTRIVQALAFPGPLERDEAARRLLARATTAEQILGAPVSWEEAARAFRSAFSDALGVELVEAEPSARELSRAEELVVEKYANPDWLRKI